MYIRKLVGEKCYLSPIDPDDADKYAAWLNDQDVTRWLTLATSVVTAAGEKEILQKISREHTYAIVDIGTDEAIGNVGLHAVNHIHRTAEIGIFIGRKDCWDKGYGSEAMSLLLDFSFRILNLNNIMLRTYSSNKRAIKCYEKIGFKKVGELREAVTMDRKAGNILFMDMLPADFYAKSEWES